MKRIILIQVLFYILGCSLALATHDIQFTYDRLGRQKTVVDAAGTREFKYNNTLQLESETISGIYNVVITRNYALAGVKGRYKGFDLGSDYKITYGYDNVGRFNSVSWNIGTNSGSVGYTYLANSDLFEQMSGTGYQVIYSYEPNRDLRTQIINKFGADILSQYDYVFDGLGRKISLANSGSAFNQSSFNRFGYNDRNELIESSRYYGTDINNLSNPIHSEHRAFQYDTIGNRQQSTKANETATYIISNLNQYSRRIEPNKTTDFEYDADGNMISMITNGSKKILKYNAENRLISVTPEIPVVGSFLVEYSYDYKGRRVRKAVCIFNGASWVQHKDVLFIWDGWNMIEEITKKDGNQKSKYFVWGFDLSQSLQGAGGVGGLVACVEGSKTYYFMYDGNGNVSQIVDSSDNSIVAMYCYDPYGNFIIDSGSEAQNNPFRFSTKYFDTETGLYYYGYRYYSPELGRWLTRDPIAEEGGINLYCMVDNDPINHIDSFGMSPWSVILKKAAKLGLKKGIKEYIENRIKKEILGSFTKGAYKKAAKELGEEALKLLDLLDSQWWELIIECIPVGGDIYGAGDLAIKLKKLDNKLDAIEKMALKLTHIVKIVPHVRERFPGKSADQIAQYLINLTRSGKHVDVGTGKTIITRGKEILIINPRTGGTYFTKKTNKSVSEYIRNFVKDEGGPVL